MDNLVKNLHENNFYHLIQEFKANVLYLLKKKGFFSYHYWDSFEKLKEGLPSKDKFHNTLINHGISNKNYEHVLNVWKVFKMHSMKEYHDLYLKVDVLLLACVFETFRIESINSFELDPAYYLSTPGYSWDALLRFTDANLKLISDIEKYQFILSKIRGGISMICKDCAEATNKFLKSHVSNRPTSYIIYLDDNDLYGHTMMQLFPTKIRD